MKCNLLNFIFDAELIDLKVWWFEVQTFEGLEKGQAEERSINCNPLMYSVFKSFYNKINTAIQLHIVVE